MPPFSLAEAPAGTDELKVSWLKIAAPELGVMLAALARPSGAGPFPSILLLHGSHGFAQEYVRLAQDLATAGFLTVAACWFRGGDGPGRLFITPIESPEAPPRPDPLSTEAMQIVGALVRTVRELPDANPGRVGVFGHSRGGGAALNYVLQVEDVQAAVLNSARYPNELAEICSELKTPILMLHGTADSPADGGTEGTNIEMARNFERLARTAGKTVERVYYDGGRHNSIFDDPAQYRDATQRMHDFFQRHLCAAFA